MSVTHKIEIKTGEKLKLLRKAFTHAIDLEADLLALDQPLLATKARKLSKIMWYNIERVYREI